MRPWTKRCDRYDRGAHARDPTRLATPGVALETRGRIRAAAGAVGETVVGAAPHVLHHLGPLAGAALLAGASGKLLFGAIGLVLTLPMLRKMRRRTGSCRLPTVLLAVMVAMFTFSTLVLGPALTGRAARAPR